MIEIRTMSRAISPRVAGHALFHLIGSAEAEILTELGMTAQLSWRVQLDQRWPDGTAVLLPWDTGEEIPDDATALICTGTVQTATAPEES